METKTKTFDAAAESRHWREATSRKLDAMTREQRLAHYARLWSEATGQPAAKPSRGDGVVRPASR